MNNDLEQFSEERLNELASTPEKYDHRYTCNMLNGDESRALARIALKVKRERPVNSPCEKCKGSGFMDSGGTQPWGEPISVECDCTTPQPAHTEHGIPSEIPKVPHNGVMAYKKDGSIYSTNYARGWNDCIQAALAAAPKPESE